MSPEPLQAVAPAYAALQEAARSLGSELADTFGQLAFMSLSVIPEARITDRGLLDLTSTGQS
jgi:adenine deaminase